MSENQATEWVLVPVKPDVNMIGAWYRYKNGHRFAGEEPARDTSDFGAYAAMLAAAPQPATMQVEVKDHKTLLKSAMFHLAVYNNWTSYNEAMFTGWGEQIVPPGAEWWRVKSGQALAALSECCDTAEEARQLSTVDYDEEGRVLTAVNSHATLLAEVQTLREALATATMELVVAKEDAKCSLEFLEISDKRFKELQADHATLWEAAAAYVASVEHEPEKDCWDTESGEYEEGAEKFASDWSWREHDNAKQKAFENLCAVLASTRGE